MASSDSSVAIDQAADDHLIVTAETDDSLLFTIGTREYRASLRVPRHACPPPAPRLQLYDRLAIARPASDGHLSAVGRCGRRYLVSNIVPIVARRGHPLA